MRHEQRFEAALRAQRVSARGELGVAWTAGRTRVDRLYQEGAAKIRMPRTVGDPLEAVLINTAGGLTGGDRLDWSIHVGDGASATVTTQTCEKVYRASSDIAKVDCRMVGRGGRPARLAAARDDRVRQFGIPADNRDRPCQPMPRRWSSRRPCSDAAPWARASDGLMFADRWRVRRTGPAGPCRGFRRRSRRQPAACCAARARRRDLCCDTACPDRSDAEQRLDAVRAIIGDNGGARSAWTVAGSGKLLARLTAEDSYALRKRLIPLIELLNGRAGLPKVWTL